MITYVKTRATHGDLLEDKFVENKIHKKYNNDRGIALKSVYKDKYEEAVGEHTSLLKPPSLLPCVHVCADIAKVLVTSCHFYFASRSI